MLTIGKEQIRTINEDAEVHLFGQEVNPQTYAMCKSDLYMKSIDGRESYTGQIRRPNYIKNWNSGYWANGIGTGSTPQHFNVVNKGF